MRIVDYPLLPIVLCVATLCFAGPVFGAPGTSTIPAVGTPPTDSPGNSTPPKCRTTKFTQKCCMTNIKECVDFCNSNDWNSDPAMALKCIVVSTVEKPRKCGTKTCPTQVDLGKSE